LPLPTQNAGHVTTAQEWSDILAFIQPLFARKTIDESVTSSTTIQDDDELSLTVIANATYDVTCHIIYQADGVGDMNVQFSGPAGASFNWVANGVASTQTATGSFFVGEGTLATTNIVVGGNGAGSSVVCRPSGLLIVGGTAGTFRFRWTQGTSSGTATIVKANSFMTARRVA